MDESAPGDEVLDDDELLARWMDVRAGVARTQQRIEHAIEATGVPAQWFPVLHLLRNAEDHRMPMSALAHDVAMSSGGFTKLADRMAREGIIDRRGSDVDRRVVHASLTADGLELAERVAHTYADAVRGYVLEVASAQELSDTATVLARLGAVPVARSLDEPDGRPADEPEARLADKPGIGPAEPAGAPPVPTRTARDPALPERRGRGRERD